MFFTRSLVVAILIALTIWFDTFTSDQSFLRRANGTQEISHRRLTTVPLEGEYEVNSLNRTNARSDIVSLSGGTESTDGPNADATDDHAMAGHPSLFEALSAIHIEIGTYSVFIIIGFIILLKQMIELLLTITEDTPFAGMIGKIEEELMIVGSSSFIFKVVLNTTKFADNIWAYPLEFAEILVPLISFAYCGLGLVLVLISLEQCFAWNRAHNLKTLEIIDDYLNATKSIFFRYLPWSKSVEQMEFRIFNSIFCNTFKIQKDAFLFDEYVTKVFQRSVLELIEIRLLDWFYVTVLLCLNLGRVKLNLQWNSCEVHDRHCHERRDVYLFTVIGAGLFAFSVALLIASQRLERTILSKHGLASHLHYAKYIQDEDEHAHLNAHHMNATSLKHAASKAKEVKASKRGSILMSVGVGSASGGHGSSDDLAGAGGLRLKPSQTPTPRASKVHPSFGAGSSHSLKSNASASTPKMLGAGHVDPAHPHFAELFALQKTEGKSSTEHPETQQHNSNLVIGIGGSASSDVYALGLTSQESGTHILSSKTPQISGKHNEPNKRDGDSENSPKGKTGSVDMDGSEGGGFRPATERRNIPIRSSMMKRSLSLRTGREVFMLGQHSEMISNVFWFGQPELYFESIQMMFMVIAFYMALWLTVMVSAAPSQLWKFLSILPSLLICCFFFQIVKTAAVLRAIYEVDSDALLEVIEETEAAKQLSDELRGKVISYLNCDGEEAYVELEHLYRQIDANGNDALSRSEFGQFMSLMQITFSAKKWERIFKEIDRNYDNDISLQEFYLFLFPDHDLALKLEMRRLKVISQRVMSRANKVLSHLSPFREVKLISSPSKMSSSTIAGDISMSLRAVNKFRKSMKGINISAPTASTPSPDAVASASAPAASTMSSAIAAMRSMRPSSASPSKPAAPKSSNVQMTGAFTATETAPTSTEINKSPVKAAAPETTTLNNNGFDAARINQEEGEEKEQESEKNVRQFVAESPTLVEHQTSATVSTAPGPTQVQTQAQRDPPANAYLAAVAPERADGDGDGVGAFRPISESPVMPAWSLDSPGPQPFLEEPSQIELSEEAGQEEEEEVGFEGVRDARLYSSDSPDPQAEEEEVVVGVAPGEAASPVDF